MTVDVLAIFAHPDDVELNCGGTLLKLGSLGYTTGILDVTKGEMGTRGSVELRMREAADAAAILKVDVRQNLELPDGHVWLTESTRTKLVRALRELKPKLLITHQHDDPHPDHNHIVQLVREASRHASLRKYDPETGGERIPAPIVAHIVFSRHVIPSFIVDVTEFAEDKMKAIAAHKSQFYDPNSTEPETALTGKTFLDRLRARMGYYGSLIEVEAGEPFYVREALNVADPLALLTRSMNIYS
ncbi:MAG TPA: bacillithiol biosynthesis deacetylase BshB1 [Pyrinomonadaceae bacterium]|jgi:bacillithiol biosynthesis deacetylase BshB1|nr:bacillithiol biosynthesis deacetylase BshB1 [Pyrinomonadaceae bacterium]